MIPWSHYKQQYSQDFILVRRAVFTNFVSHGADIIEENLTPEDVVKLIQQVGNDYVKKSKRRLELSDIE